MAKGWLIGGGVFLVVLLVASIIVALLEREEPLPPGTPQAAVQEFLRATQNENYEVAYGFLSEELQRNCSLTQFVGQRFPGDTRLDNARITLENVNTVNDTAFVDARITQFFGSGPFGTSESTFTQRYSLKQVNGEWKFAEYPWPFFNCPFWSPEPPRPAPTPGAAPEAETTPAAP